MMASPHPPYTQPGPSSQPYYIPPPHFAFDGNSSYQPPNPRIVNGIGHSNYHNQRPLRGGGSAYHPHSHYQPPQPYQPGFYAPPEYQHTQHIRPPLPPYQQHRMGGVPMHMNRASNGPSRSLPFTNPNAMRHSSGPFSPPFHPHSQQYPHASPNNSPSALPKQVLMLPPQSPLQHPLPLKPASHVEPEPPPPLSSSQEAQPSTSVSSSPSLKSSSPTSHPFSPTQRLRSPNSPIVAVTDTSSPAPITPNLSPISHSGPPSVQYEAFPERSNATYSLRYRRPELSTAVAVTVKLNARPSRYFYDLTASLEDGKVKSPMLPSVKAHLVSPESSPSLSAANPLPLPESPPQQSLPSSTATTTSTSPHMPIPGSPLSSVTSVSLPAKSPSSKVLASPAVSVGTIATDASEVPSKLGPTPLKKTWASLLRPVSSDGQGTPTPSPNNLPVSSVQGFSVPAMPSTSTIASGSSAALVALIVAPHILTGPVPPLRPRGLVNLGNMCFANTVLQLLMFCTPFYQLFVELAHTPRGDTVCATPLVDATVALVKEFQVSTKPREDEDVGRDAFVPSCIYDALKEKRRFDSMRGGQQEDAEEFLGFYLDTLEEELLSMIANVDPPVTLASVEERVEKNTPSDGWLEVGKKNKSVLTRTHKSLESPISRIFGGRFRTALRVPGTRESVIVDPWSRLQLDIQPDDVHTIEDALRHTATPGTVQVTRPDSQVDASQQTLIDALPPVLVLHLKRFLYDTVVGDVVKLRKRVSFGTELEVPKEAMAATRRSKSHIYKLFGVLNHHGSSATGGHYTLDVLHPNAREGWLRIDDEVVQHVQEEELLAGEFGDDRTAYLLFYQHIATPGARI